MKLYNSNAQLGVLAFQALGLVKTVFGVLTEESVEISAAFPIENQFGVVFNGQPNKILLKINNMGSDPVQDVMRIHSAWNEFREIGGKERLLRKGNPTPSKRTVAPATNTTIPYFFSAEQKEGNLNLRVWVEWSGPKTKKHRTMAYDSTITIQEPPTRWFDPQLIFLYIIILSALGFVGYLSYTSFSVPTKTLRKASSSAGKSSTQTSSTPKIATPTGGMYEEEWIPSGHSIRSTKKPATESGGEDTSGTEGKPRRRKR